MADDESDRERHRELGRQLFNGTWDLIEKPDRSTEEDVQMFLSAAASRWHWGNVGGVAEISTGDWQVAHVASLLGWADVALRFAERNLEAAASEGWEGWRLASAHEGMARAFAALGDADGRARHMAQAEAALAREPVDEEREVIAGQLATVPEVGSEE